MVLWAAVDTRDKYKRLCAVADTPQELADMMHVKVSTIYECVSKAKKGLAPERYIRVEIPDDLEETQNLINAVDLAGDYNSKVPEGDWLAYQAAVMKKETEGRK